jgi:hypothetical protein
MRNMVKAIMVAVILTIGFTATIGAAKAATVHSSGWYDNATCHAFTGWQRHHTGWPNVINLSRHADYYLRYDVGELNHVMHVRASKAIVRQDAYYVHLDCTTNGDN